MQVHRLVDIAAQAVHASRGDYNLLSRDCEVPDGPGNECIVSGNERQGQQRAEVPSGCLVYD